MPAKIKKKGKCYQVKTPEKITARCTTKKKAEGQKKLLNALKHNPNFKLRKK